MRDFDSNAPRPGYEDAPRITAAQMDRFLHEGLGSKFAEKVAAAINESQGYYEHDRGIDFSTDAPPKPEYLPIKRKVRFNDLEDGCVLRFCGSPATQYFIDRGMLTIGKEYTIRKHRYGVEIDYDVPGPDTGVATGSWTSLSPEWGWEFVSNPNYVHGFRIGETVYSTGGPDGCWGSYSDYGPYTVESANRYYDDGITVADGQGVFPAKYLTRDPTKAYGYAAPVEYKVKDGVAKEGDVIWWLANYGDPEKVIVGGLNWDRNADNVKGYPEAYQLREPQKVWDYKVK